AERRSLEVVSDEGGAEGAVQNRRQAKVAGAQVRERSAGLAELYAQLQILELVAREVDDSVGGDGHRLRIEDELGVRPALVEGGGEVHLDEGRGQPLHRPGHDQARI